MREQPLENFLPTLQNEDSFTRCLIRFLKAVVRIKTETPLAKARAQSALKFCQRILMQPDDGTDSSLLREDTKGWCFIKNPKKRQQQVLKEDQISLD